MAAPDGSLRGSVVSLWRHPVKSMMGEELNAFEITPRGVLGDRPYALIDTATGKVVSAKNPRLWGAMFEFRAALLATPHVDSPMPSVRITFPDGREASSVEPDIDQRLSATLGRAVRLAASVPEGSKGEGYWPDHEWLPDRDQVFDVDLHPGTFFDGSSVHLLTTATLDRLRSLAPRSRFEARRFRPNLVIDAGESAEGFAENAWIGQTLAVGREVRLQVERPCPRCVMTTLPQGDLPKDPIVLRTAVQQNAGNVGVYASVIQGGRVRRGDVVTLA